MSGLDGRTRCRNRSRPDGENRGCAEEPSPASRLTHPPVRGCSLVLKTRCLSTHAVGHAFLQHLQVCTSDRQEPTAGPHRPNAARGDQRRLRRRRGAWQTSPYLCGQGA
jgi:hypothetical protein